MKRKFYFILLMGSLSSFAHAQDSAEKSWREFQSKAETQRKLGDSVLSGSACKDAILRGRGSDYDKCIKASDENYKMEAFYRFRAAETKDNADVDYNKEESAAVRALANYRQEEFVSRAQASYSQSGTCKGVDTSAQCKSEYEWSKIPKICSLKQTCAKEVDERLKTAKADGEGYEALLAETIAKYAKKAEAAPARVKIVTRSANSFAEIGGEELRLTNPGLIAFDETVHKDQDGNSYVAAMEKDGCVFTLSPVESFPYVDGYRLGPNESSWRAFSFRESTKLHHSVDCASLQPEFQRECRRNTFDGVSSTAYRTPNEIAVYASNGGRLKVFRQGRPAEALKCLEAHGFTLPQIPLQDGTLMVNGASATR